MSESSLSKDLEAILGSAERECTTAGVQFVRGFVNNTDETPEIIWSTENPDLIRSFVTAAKKSNAVCIVAEAIRLTEEELESALREAEENEDTDRIRSLKALENKVDSIIRLVLSFVPASSSVVLTTEIMSEAHELLNPDDQLGDFEEDENDSPNDEEIEKAVTALVRDEKFMIATKKAQRLMIAKRKFASEEWADQPWALRAIVDKATTVFELDVAPLREQELADAASKLLSEGSSKREIAKKLGISLAKLSKIL